MKELFGLAERVIGGILPFSLLLCGGVWLTVRTGFYQLRCLPKAIRYAFHGMFERKKGAFSPFRSACTALSATVGTGNIAGVASAVSLGGAGAVFWMWVSAFFGMCVKSAEIALGIRFRERGKEGCTGGPMYIIRNGLGKRFSPLASLFCIMALIACFCSGAITQTNAVAALCGSGAARWILGAFFAGFCFVAMRGGKKRIGAINETLVPIMATLYLIFCAVAVFVHRSALPGAFSAIVSGAFAPRAVTGGAVGSLISTVAAGASRGVFSNEAGLGTAAMAHAAAESEDSAQTLYGIFEVFMDTIVICTLTALTILTAGVTIEYGTQASTELVRAALFQSYGAVSGILLAGMMCLFSITSVIGWGFYGRICLSFLPVAGKEGLFAAVYSLCCVAGAVFPADTAWRLAAVSTGGMLCINLPAVWMLSETAVLVLKEGTKLDQRKN